MKDKKPIERWHGSHHYSDKIHLLFIFFLFFTVITILFAYFEFNNPRFYYRSAVTPTYSEKSAITPTISISPSPTSTTSGSSENPVFCTMEAKLCPNGSYVGRVGPKCEFSKCP